MVSLRVNGTSRMFDGDDDMPLLWYLRDELRLTGTRFGCGAGLCGACAPVGHYSTRKKRMTTSLGYRSPIPTKSDRVIHCSSGADVSNFGWVRK